MKDIIRMNQLAGIITEGQAKKMMEVLNEDQNSFKSGDKVLIQTSKELVPAIYIEKTNNGHQVKITKTMMGYKSGDVVEVGDKGIVPV